MHQNPFNKYVWSIARHSAASSVLQAFRRCVSAKELYLSASLKEFPRSAMLQSWLFGEQLRAIDRIIIQEKSHRESLWESKLLPKEGFVISPRFFEELLFCYQEAEGRWGCGKIKAYRGFLGNFSKLFQHPGRGRQRSPNFRNRKLWVAAVSDGYNPINPAPAGWGSFIFN